MVTKRWILLVLSAVAISMLAGCGGNNTLNPQNQPPPPPANVSIQVSTTLPSPPQTLSIGQSSTVSATVTEPSNPNDPNNFVNWELVSCRSDFSNCSVQACATTPNACGILYAPSDPTKTPVATSKSGDTLSYQPPSSFPVPGNNLFIGIVAVAVADPTKNKIVSAQIGAFDTILTSGNYVFQVQGNSAGSTYQMAGVLALDATSDSCSGFITAGQQTLNAAGASVTSPIIGTAGAPCAPVPPSNSSSFFVGPDGRGTITLNYLTNPSDPTSVVAESFSLIALSSSRALIAELDSNSSGGTLQLQDPAAASTLPTGGYAFVASGTDTGSTPIAFGGVVNIDNNPSPGSFSGKGSIANEDHYNVASFPCPPPKGLVGTVSPVAGPVPGVVTFNFASSICAAGNTFGPTQITGYIADKTHIQLIESDNTFLTSGPAIAQASAPGSFGLQSFSGPYVMGIQGIAPISALPASFTSATVVCPDGAGGLDSCTDANGAPSGGFTDTFLLADNAPLPGGVNSICPTPFSNCPGAVSAELSGNYALDPGHIGRVNFTSLKFNPQPVPTNPIHPNILFFLTGAPGTSPALVLYAGGKDTWYPALGVGIAYPQQQPASGLTFGNPETYSVSFTQENGVENDGTGWMTSTPNTLTGAVDDFLNIGLPALPLSDTFTCGATTCADSFGRIAGTFLTNGTSAPPPPAAGEYYFANPNQGFFVETDLITNFVTGAAPAQVSLAYFEACDKTLATCQQPSAGSSAKRASSAHAKPARATRKRPSR